MPQPVPHVQFFPASVIGNPAIRPMLRGLLAANEGKPKRRQARSVRARWCDELIRWFQDRGVKSDTAIAKVLGIDRSTLWRWKQGTPPTDANIATILEKTNGQIDPRPRRRRGQPA